MPIADPMEDAGAGVFACSRTDPLASALYGARVERRRGASGMDIWISGACSFDCSDRRRGCQSPPATSGSPVEPLSGSGRSRLATTAPCSSWGAMRPRDWSALGFTGLAYCSRPLHLLFDGLNKVQQIDNSQVRGSLFARAVSRPTANPFTALLGFEHSTQTFNSPLTTAPALARCASPLRRDKLVRQRRPRSTRSIITAAKKACGHVAAAPAAEPLVTKPLHDPPDVLYVHRLGVPPQLQGVLQPGGYVISIAPPPFSANCG
ncbi:hypothetical protein COCVIDRAFT_16109 [Bipolaris victoriae FI3]|uniref:Uncharacterized protein n=1 Tax=Bipolaris victoriae (strain FI3) TaxID=930091 RepID=W7EJM7_BIPV3|nr:hypothetical protein COCVIDRAFT_16109 [Bipolaris victoriae FI3]